MKAGSLGAVGLSKRQQGQRQKSATFAAMPMLCGVCLVRADTWGWVNHGLCYAIGLVLSFSCPRHPLPIPRPRHFLTWNA